jgi:putative phosphoribosyl transferase
LQNFSEKDQAVDHHFKNRTEAGQLLAKQIKPLITEKPYVFALPRGGVPTAAPIAEALGTEVDLLLVKKIPAPRQPELAIGAIAEEGPPLWQDQQFAGLKIDKSERERLLIKAQKSLARQRRLWKTDSHVTNITDHTVILVDDGLATGASVIAGIQFLRTRKPAKIILAVPVASQSAIRKIRPLVDELICLSAPESFESVSEFYDDFSPVTDREVTDLLRPFRAAEF